MRNILSELEFESNGELIMVLMDYVLRAQQHFRSKYWLLYVSPVKCCRQQRHACDQSLAVPVPHILTDRCLDAVIALVSSLKVGNLLI